MMKNLKEYCPRELIHIVRNTRYLVGLTTPADQHELHTLLSAEYLFTDEQWSELLRYIGENK